ncbi:MAG TPA: mannitol dehydrogenase family protein [Rhizomicrobium sp.]|nr:mannitol dehydrogenase family protein [Rhizomicrobium sp.]
MLEAPQLSAATLDLRRDGVGAPAYDRDRVLPGIVHFGPGAFGRAHIASFVEQVLTRDPRWGIAAIALRQGALAETLKAQDFLYTVVELDAEPRYRVLGALKDYCAAPADPARAFAYLENPAARLVTITVTEKGYCLNADGALDVAHPDVAGDLRGHGVPVSLVGWIVEALSRRRAKGLAPFTVMSCDNLASNGPKLRRAAIAFAEAAGKADLARFIEGEVRFPATMVDSITPATDEALRARVAQATGLSDAAPVQRESFVQWVVEDCLGPGMPDFASAGVQLTNDVHAHEQAKLRLLNGAHSALAYLGLLRGRDTVVEAMADVALAGFVERMMREDVAATLAPGLDIQSYIDALLARLRNPAIAHRLTQIAADGSLKLPYRLLEPIADLRKLGRPVARHATAVAGWMKFVVTRCGQALDDPLAPTLMRIASACQDSGATDVSRFLSLRAVFPATLADDNVFVAAATRAYDDLEDALSI